MAPKTAKTFRVITPDQIQQARRGRTATLNPEVTEALAMVAVSGETHRRASKLVFSQGVVLEMFGAVPEKNKRPNVASKIQSHWKELHGANAPALTIAWIPGEDLPQVFAVAAKG